MRKLIATGLLTLISQSALGADLPLRSPPPVFEPTPVLTWTGLYVGGTVGGTWGDFGGGSDGKNLYCTIGVSNCASTTYTTANHTIGSGNSSGSIAGGAQLGYDQQINENVLVGGVIDVTVMDRKSGVHTALALTPLNNSQPEMAYFDQVNKSRWLSTARLRLGYVNGDLLIYGTGGLAVADLSSSSSSRNIVTPLVGNPVTMSIGSGSVSGAAFGWTVGAGLEYRFAPHWAFGVEYLYYHVQKTYTVAVAGQPGTPAAGLSSTYGVKAKLDGNLLRASINYLF